MSTQLKVGDILYSSWGYDQTNIDFYKVLEITKSGKSAKIQMVDQKITRQAGFMCEYVIPNPSVVHPHNKNILTKRIREYNGKPYLSLTNYSGAQLWDGEEKYQSHYA